MTGPFEEEPPTRYVGVGIGTYKEYPPLPGAPAEARQIADLLGPKGVQTVVAAATTEPELIAELARVLPPRPEGGGALVLLWAGHGDRLEDASLRLVAQDTAKKGAPLLTPEYVASVAVRSGATQLLLIFDTCFSGGGALPALEGADRWFSGQVGPPGKRWLGVLASAMDWERARDDLFGDRLARLLREGPAREDLRLRWSAQNAGIRGDDLIDALQKEWADDAPHRPKATQLGNPWVLLPNPRHDPAAPPRVVEHLLLAARGGEPEDETWYFTGRHAVIARLVSWIVAGQPGLHVVTGPAGCGKSAVLGLVVCLSNPEQRAALLARGPLDYADPGVGLVDAHVYARGLARNQLVRELDAQLSDAGVLPADRRGQRGAGELADAAAASATCPVIVIDGLDEAGVEAWPIAEDVLRPLARHAVVLVGTRELPSPDNKPSLVTRLQPDGTGVVHLLAEVDDAADVHDYVVRRLRGVGAPAMDAGQIAAAFLALPSGDEEGRFLLARVITAQLRTNPLDTTCDDWQQHLSTSVEDALDHDLAALPTRTRGEDQLESAGFDLLAALAWAKGGGLPDDIWPLIATAISAEGTAEYTREDAFWALAAAGRYIVEAGEAGHAVYRLYHQRLAQHLRDKVSGGGVQGAELRIAVTLTITYQALLEAGVPPSDHPYLWRYAWRHCADAGTAGIAAFRQLVEIDRDAFLPHLARALWVLGRDSRDQDHLDEAIGYFEQALAGFRQLGKLAEQEEVLDDLGNVYRDHGTVQRSNELREKGIVCFRESLSIAQRLGDRSGQAVSLGNLGLGYYSLRDLDPAIDYLEQSAAMFRVLGERAQLGRTLAYLGRAQEKAVGRGEEGMDTLRQSITILREVGDRYAEAEALDGLGRAYSARGRSGEALDCFEQRRTIYQELGKPPPMG